MPAIFEYSLTVPPEAIDLNGHANNVEYVRWFQDAAIAHSAAQGWDGARYQAAGAGWVVRSHFIEYLQPVFEGESLMIRTWVSTMKTFRSLRKYRLYRPADGALIARAETDWVFFNFAAGKLAKVPPEILDSFILVAEDPKEEF